jgi:hypothetical protein
VSRVALVLVTLALALATPLGAQRLVRVGVHSLGMTYAEVSEAAKSEGVGGAATLQLRWRRFGLEGLVSKARLKPVNDDELQEYDIVQVDVRFNFWIAPIVGLEIGGEWWTIDPEFAAQEVGAGRIGIVSQYPLARISEIWARAAYLVNPRFSGGGEAGLAIDLGLGIGVGTSNGRFRVVAESNFQRIDRRVNSVEVPLQVTQARLGVVVGF